MNNTDGATWEKLVESLNQMNEKAMAEMILQGYVKAAEEQKDAASKVVSIVSCLSSAVIQ